jgi:hypothetical protein
MEKIRLKIKLKRFCFFTPIALFFFTLFFSSCGNNETTSEKEGLEGVLDEDYYEFKGISLKEHGIPAFIMLPDETTNIGASTKPEIIHTDGDFIWDINVGPNFSLHIEDYGDYTNMVEFKKKELQEQDLFKIKFLLDEKELIVYESTLIVKGSKKASPSVGVEHKSYHVYGQKIINDVTYELRSRDEGYEKMIIELMAKSIKSFKAAK